MQWDQVVDEVVDEMVDEVVDMEEDNTMMPDMVVDKMMDLTDLTVNLPTIFDVVQEGDSIVIVPWIQGRVAEGAEGVGDERTERGGRTEINLSEIMLKACVKISPG
jgi:hypothetical protein